MAQSTKPSGNDHEMVDLVMHENLRGSRRMRLMFDHLVEHCTAYIRESRAE